jgi:predicted O-methyltransferase YrrM
MSTALVEPKIPGWFHHGASILDLVKQHQPQTCVELGTWQGASAIPVARMIQRWGGTLTCVDTWAGELDEHGGSKPNRPPVMLSICARNIVEAGVSANVRFVVARTADAAKVWPEPIDFLYIDADHSEAGVAADLAAWAPHVRSGGIIAGDDYGNAYYPGVAWAWDAFEQRTGIALTRVQSDPPQAQGVQLVYGVAP